MLTLLRRFGRATVALLLLATWAHGCGIGAPARIEVPVDSAAGEVPFDWTGLGGAAMTVPVWIDGQGPYDLVLDTGATLTCLDSALVQEIGLPPRRGAVGVGAGVGGTGRLRLHQLDSLRVGNALAADLTICSLDLSHLGRVSPGVQGLLGLNFLKNFRVTLDFERRIVHFAPRE